MWVNGSFTTLKLQEFSQCLPWQNEVIGMKVSPVKDFIVLCPIGQVLLSADYPGNTHGHGKIGW
jgi:hypothetical protein